MKKKTLNLLILFMIISLISVACKISMGGNEPTAEPIIVSQDAAETAQNLLDSATISGTDNEIVAFTVTEEQVTSLAVEQLTNSGNTNISNPQIYLQDGKIDVYAVYTQDYFDVNVHLTLVAEIDANGELKVTIENADLGSFPAPDGFLESLSSMIDDTITNSLLPAVTGFKMQSIYIADGMATISGTVTQ
jgi:hypothetical protein